jgi:hypothetical protein
LSSPKPRGRPHACLAFFSFSLFKEKGNTKISLHLLAAKGVAKTFPLFSRKKWSKKVATREKLSGISNLASCLIVAKEITFFATHMLD